MLALDQVLLEQQRTGFAAGNGNLDLRDTRYQRLGPGALPPVTEITRHALAQIARLADIEQRTAGVVHLVDARQFGEVAHIGCGIEAGHREFPQEAAPAARRQPGL